MSGAVVAGMAIAPAAEAATIGFDFFGTGYGGAGGIVTGMFETDETSVEDGLVSEDELISWMFSFNGLPGVDAFEISSNEANASVLFFEGFQVSSSAPVDQGVDFTSLGAIFPDLGTFEGDAGSIDLEFGFIFSNANLQDGEPVGKGSAVVTPQPVPEPMTLLGILAVGGLGYASRRRHLAQ
ncbi:MAG: PEP-CTERM sorting domain-containing protein [Cyanobacteria bacterium P01_H01_bin.162]